MRDLHRCYTINELGLRIMIELHPTITSYHSGTNEVTRLKTLSINDAREMLSEVVKEAHKKGYDVKRIK